MGIAVLAALTIGAADLTTKWIVRTSLAQYQQVELVGDYLRLTHIYNPGAAFGIHLGPYSRPVFLILGILALGVVVAMLVADPPETGPKWWLSPRSWAERWATWRIGP